MSERCKELRHGKFISTINDGVSWVEIERKNDLQIERSGNDETTCQITWISDCSYDIILISVPDDMPYDEVGKKFRITIDRIDSDKYYYSFYNEKSEVSLSGYMKKAILVDFPG